MELERALFRVYERSLEGLRSDHRGRALRPSQVCTALVYALLVGCGLLTAGVARLHVMFVNKPGCLGAIVEEEAALQGLLVRPPPPPALDRRRRSLNAVALPLEDSNATEPTAGSEVDMGGGEGAARNGSTGGENGGGSGEGHRRDDYIALPSGNLIPKDTLLQIRIGNGLFSDGPLFGDIPPTADRYDRYAAYEGENGSEEEYGPEGFAENETDADGNGGAGNGGAGNGTAVPYDFTFAFEPAVLLLPTHMRREHGFPELNVTLPAECFGGPLARGLLRGFGGFSTPVINFLMFTFRSEGLLRGEFSEEEWWWMASSVPPAGGRSMLDNLLFKASAVMRGMVAFMLLTTVTALIVRTLLSSGVIVMFPLFLCLERMELGGVDLRILSLSYPWLGLPIEVLRRTHKPVTPFIMGHIMQVVVLYSMYNASQVAWNMWLYEKRISGAVQIWLYGLVMMWEYYSLIFVRSAAAIRFFPRLVAMVFVLYHCYLYYFPQAFFDMAALALFGVVLAAMIFTVVWLEVPACQRGEVSIEHPRAHFVELPWPAWGAALPPSWTLFVPPTATVRGIYSDVVPERPGGNGGGFGGGARDPAEAAEAGAAGGGARNAAAAEAGGAGARNSAAGNSSGAGAGGGGNAGAAGPGLAPGSSRRGHRHGPPPRGPSPPRGLVAADPYGAATAASLPGRGASPARIVIGGSSSGEGLTDSADGRDTREEERRPLRRRGSANASGFYSSGGGGGGSGPGSGGGGDVELGLLRS